MPDTDKYARRVYVRDGPDRSIGSRIPGLISDIGPEAQSEPRCSTLKNAVTLRFKVTQDN